MFSFKFFKFLFFLLTLGFFLKSYFRLFFQRRINPIRKRNIRDCGGSCYIIKKFFIYLNKYLSEPLPLYCFIQCQAFRQILFHQCFNKCLLPFRDSLPTMKP